MWANTQAQQLNCMLPRMNHSVNSLSFCENLLHRLSVYIFLNRWRNFFPPQTHWLTTSGGSSRVSVCTHFYVIRWLSINIGRKSFEYESRENEAKDGSEARIDLKLMNLSSFEKFFQFLCHVRLSCKRSIFPHHTSGTFFLN